MLRSVAALSLALACAVPAIAQSPGSCQLGQAQGALDVSGVRVVLQNTGALFQDSRTGGLYEVPLGTGASPIYTAGLWVGGTTNPGTGPELHMAGSRYDNFEFWPGPLDDDGTLPEEGCASYDRIWVVSAADIRAFESGDDPAADLAEWPVLLGAPVIAAPDNGFDDDGDSFFDEGTDGEDNDDDGLVDEHDEQELVVPAVRRHFGLPPYDLSAGDRPEVLGTQTAFWIMNDVGNEHLETGTPPIGLEVRVSAFAVGTDNPALHNATFYRYTFVQKSPVSLRDAYVSVFLDADVGESSDDYVGSDTTRSLAFSYNAAPMDAVYGLPPAVGLDLYGAFGDADGDGEIEALTASRVMYFDNVTDLPTGDPNTGTEYYNVMRGLWADGTPLTEGGDGYMSSGSVVPFAFPGAPEADQFWSETNLDGGGSAATPGDRRLLVSAGPFDGTPFSLEFGLLYAQGSDHLDSVTELRAVSDALQARYDTQALFVPFDEPPAVPLGIPALTTPADGTSLFDTDVDLAWTGVPGALRYRVERDTAPDFSNPDVFFSLEPNLSLDAASFPANEARTYFWRVRAERYGTSGDYPPARSFSYYRYAFDDFGNGTGIVEITHPDTEVCPDGSPDPGCAEYDGNTVWLDANSTGDYVLTNENNDLSDLLRNAEVIQGDDFEIRFTESCVSSGGCLGVYASAILGGDDLIAFVPFELWNIGAEADPDDDIRMIPVLRGIGEFAELVNWADTFPNEQSVVVGQDVLTLPVTQQVLGMMPDRPNGYARFEADAYSFGGPGSNYDPDNDGDTQIDFNPGNDQECRRQNYYIDFCYRGGNTLAVVPIGGRDGIVFADLAGDGTTPPAGTTIRFDAPERRVTVAAEDEGPEVLPQSLVLDAPYPNPLRTSATVSFHLNVPSDVRLAAYDVLGRRVAILAEGLLAAGTHRATFKAGRLAGGVYLLVLEADGHRQARKVVVAQ